MNPVMLLTALLLQQEILEEEPNNSSDTIRQSIAPGGAVSGSIAESGDCDWFAVECAQDAVGSFVLTVSETCPVQLKVRLRERELEAQPEHRPVRLLRVRLPKGRTAIRIAGETPAGYRLELQPVTDLDGKELEPNDEVEQAIALTEGRPAWGQASGSGYDVDCYTLEVKQEGPRHLVLKRLTPELKGRLTLSPDPSSDRQYVYEINTSAEEFHFYPVFNPGTALLKLALPGETAPGSAYELTVLPYEGKVTPDEIRRAQAAIERAVAWLARPPEGRAFDDAGIAAEAMALAALAEGHDARERAAAIERDYVAWLDQAFEKVEVGTWKGREVHRCGGVYAHAMATLGLAEAAADGSERARKLCERAAEYLLAAQHAENKCKEWNGPFDAGHPHYGGWRYAPDATDTDVSIAGWCTVALTAVDAAGLRIPGLRDTLSAAVEGIARLSSGSGFGYEEPGGDSNIHNSIGALVMLLFGGEALGLKAALANLDDHLPAATQVDRGDNYVLYYLYYATRANYLRGGSAWETWRAVAIRQLLRRQTQGGSWTALHNEVQAGDRWTTALGIMVLRLCLNEAPKYLKLEVRGF